MLIFKNLQTAVNIRASLACIIESSLIFLWYCTKVDEPLVLLVNPLDNEPAADHRWTWESY